MLADSSVQQRRIARSGSNESGKLVNPVGMFWSQTPGALLERVRDLGPGLSSSVLSEFVKAQGSGVVNDEAAQDLGATTIAQDLIDELASKYKDSFEFWDALFRTIPSASALVELSPVAFNEQATEALAYLWPLGESDRW